MAGRLGSYAETLIRPFGGKLREAGRAVGLGSRHELSVLLCDGPTMRRINRRWLGKDRATNVLSFPLHELSAGEVPNRGSVGDIVLALPVVRREAKAQGLTFDQHGTHLLVHGLLHLIGYDHERRCDATRMETEERRILKALRPLTTHE